MANWIREFRRLTRDFQITEGTTENIITTVLEKHGNKSFPTATERNNYMYDRAWSYFIDLV